MGNNPEVEAPVLPQQTNRQDQRSPMITAAYDSTKSQIGDLLKTKNPISWIMGVNRMKNSLFETIEMLSDDLQAEFDGFKAQKSTGILYDLDFYDSKSPSSFENPLFFEFIRDSRYFDPELYFETYSKSDSEFKGFVQKIRSTKTSFKVLQKDIERPEYREFLEIVEPLISGNFIRMSLAEIASEAAFMHRVIEMLSGQEKGESLVELTYRLFPLDLEKFDSMNFTKNNSLSQFLHHRKEDGRDLDKEWKTRADLLADSFRPSVNYLLAVIDFSEKAKSLMDDTLVDMLMAYYHRAMQQKYYKEAPKDRFVGEMVRSSVSRSFWERRRLNWRTKIRNKESQQYLMLERWNDFRRIFLQLQTSVFSDFTKPFFIALVSEKLALPPDLYIRMKFFFLFVLPKNYAEYQMIYRLLTEYEQYRNGTAMQKIRLFFGVLAVIVLLVAATAYSYSAILAAGVCLFLLGAVLKRIDFRSPLKQVRYHTGVQGVGAFTLALYALFALNQNGFIEVQYGKQFLSEYRSIVYARADVVAPYVSKTLSTLGQGVASVLERNVKR